MTRWSTVCVFANGLKTCALVEAPNAAVARVLAVTKLGRVGAAWPPREVLVERANR